MADITINGLTATTSPATTDEVGIWDVGAGQYKKVTRANLIGATITGGGTIALGGFTLTVGATSTVTGSITGGGTVATAGFTLTVPATGTASLLATAQTVTALKTVAITDAGVGTLTEAARFGRIGAATSTTARVCGISFSDGDNPTLTAAVGGSRVSSSADFTGDLVFYVSTSATPAITTLAGLTERMRLYSNGNLIVGGTYIGNALAGSGNRAVYSDPSGTLTNSSSDLRMKSNIVSIDVGDALEIVDSLRPIRYQWRDDLRERLGQQVELGLIAQEVAPVAPEVVGVNSDGTLSLDYARLVPVLIGAIQKLTERVSVLERNST